MISIDKVEIWSSVTFEVSESIVGLILGKWAKVNGGGQILSVLDMTDLEGFIHYKYNYKYNNVRFDQFLLRLNQILH